MIKRMLLRLSGSAMLMGYALSAHAVAQGMYLGFATGPASNGASNANVTASTGNTLPPGPCVPGPANNQCQTPTTFNTVSFIGKPSSRQWGSRFFIGYMFNEWAGTELGFNFFSSVQYNVNLPPGWTAAGSTNASVRDVDLNAKFAAPLSMFDVYLRLGIAITYLTTGSGLNPPTTKRVPNQPPGSTPLYYVAAGSSKYTTKYNPIIAIGASWDITQSWVTDISYSRLSVGGVVKNIDFIAVSLAYHFVDRYCGQFLCDD